MTKMRQEQGTIMATAMLLIMAMMMVGLATMSVVDNQTGQSRKERERESTFNLTEGVLTSQTFVLGRNGTGSVNSQFPNICVPSSTSNLCPHPDELARSFDAATQKDFGANLSWQTSVRDNEDANNRIGDSNPSNASDYYDPSLTDSDCTSPTRPPYVYCYDANGDNQLWVRATSSVRGKTRTIVALINVELRPVGFPQYAVLAGSFATSNNGRKVIVDTTPKTIAVRCTTSGPSSGDPCLGYDAGKGQLAPPGSYETGKPNQPAVTDDDLQSLEDAARGAGTWYSTCPANPNGKIVYVKSGNCAYNNSAPAATGQSTCCNSSANPGLFVIENGTFSINGNISFYGVIYAVNKQNSSGILVTTGGTSLVQGGVIVDGSGKVSAGSSGLNIKFDANAFNGIASTGTAGVVQNTWRELPAD